MAQVRVLRVGFVGAVAVVFLVYMVLETSILKNAQESIRTGVHGGIASSGSGSGSGWEQQTGSNGGGKFEVTELHSAPLGRHRRRIVVVSGKVSGWQNGVWNPWESPGRIVNGVWESVDFTKLKGPALTPLEWPLSLWSSCTRCHSLVSGLVYLPQLWDTSTFDRTLQTSEAQRSAEKCAQGQGGGAGQTESFEWHTPFALSASGVRGDVLFWNDLEISPLRIGNLWMEATVQQLMPLTPSTGEGKFFDRWTGLSEVHIGILKNENVWAPMETDSRFFYMQSPYRSRWSHLFLKIWRECDCEEITFGEGDPDGLLGHCLQAALLPVIVSFVLEHTYAAVPAPFEMYSHYIHDCADVWRDQSLLSLAREEGGCMGSSKVWAQAPKPAVLLQEAETGVLCSQVPCATSHSFDSPGDPPTRHLVGENGRIVELSSVWLYSKGYGDAGLAGPVHLGAPQSAAAAYVRFREKGRAPEVSLVPSVWGALYPVRPEDGAVLPSEFNLSEWGSYKDVRHLLFDSASQGSKVFERHASIRSEEDVKWFQDRVVRAKKDGCHREVDFVKAKEEQIRFLVCADEGTSRFTRWLKWQQKIQLVRKRSQKRKDEWESIWEYWKRESFNSAQLQKEKEVAKWWEELEGILSTVSQFVDLEVFCSAPFQTDLDWRELSAVFPDTAAAVGRESDFNSAVAVLSSLSWPPPLVTEREIEAALVWILWENTDGAESPKDFPGPEDVNGLGVRQRMERLAKCRFEMLQTLTGVDMQLEDVERVCHSSTKSKIVEMKPSHSALWCSNDFAGGSASRKPPAWPHTWSEVAPELALFCFTRTNPFSRTSTEKPEFRSVLGKRGLPIRWMCPKEHMLGRDIGYECTGATNLFRGPLSKFNAWRDPFDKRCQQALVQSACEWHSLTQNS
uniref:Uncharacterized protein n=1 Tax=Chromera velia CCMP2878 TaxID=1169474 RepID=A0A0G4H3I5_9ALVE|eukprot:Cvel_5647.t1-p1 / transcript=Cvel_5647.t1 / gene=Cvel_5647 / organism=Chromera_velia_CCMP2878 / gene_product=hypothetical protein / transcript_product=hypothetical protein / location=Cvel_scaffold266:84731-89223(+) / protein_length=904 / sequence_SO=supercontig / SO=protein_coding / is_pseudo=false